MERTGPRGGGLTDIVLAKHRGFCFGVKRAVEIVDKALVQGPFPVWTLGPIIHNPTVVSDFAQRGVRLASCPEEVTTGTLVQRSHGTTRDEISRIPPGVYVVDATCPFVARAQRKAQQCFAQGITVLLVGDREHPEVKAVLSEAGPTALCIRDSSEVQSLLEELTGHEVEVIAQTTMRAEEVEKVTTLLKKAGISVHSANTICTATRERQEATAELARQCQVVLAVGGKRSANTAQLLRIAKEAGARAYLIETADDIDPKWLAGAVKVGVTAGASTPDKVIKEVVGIVEEIGKSNPEEKLEEAKVDNEQVKDPQQEPPKTPEAPEVLERSDKSEQPECKECKESQESQEENAAHSLAEPQHEPEREESGEAVSAPEPEEGKSQAELAKELYDESFKALQEGQIVRGRVVSVDENGALVDVGAKSEGLIPAQEMQRRGAIPAQQLSPGDDVMVYVLSFDSEGGLRLSKRKADEEIAWRALEEAYRESSTVEAPVAQEVKGGLVVDVGLRGFVPASQVERGYVNDLSKYVGQILRLKVLELDRSKNRVVLSQRVVLEEEHERLCQETWATITEGQTRQGVVKGITDFGVFVDLGGVDGLLHISELSWGRVKHPSEIVREGQELTVKVLRVDKDKGKISLGRKQVLPDPWDNVEQDYPVGATVEGEVTRTAPFGAFVQLEPGVEGLVHISEISMRHIAKPEEEVNAGDIVRVKVLRVRPDERRIGLSIRQADQPADSYEYIAEPEESGVDPGDFYPKMPEVVERSEAAENAEPENAEEQVPEA